jgi:hypothetical protein
VLVVTMTYDHAARRRSYELIAQEFGLNESSEVQEPQPKVATTLSRQRS